MLLVLDGFQQMLSWESPYQYNFQIRNSFISQAGKSYLLCTALRNK
jgi:hypothetical protein